MNINDLPERIACKIEPEPMSGCWLWTSAVDRQGYGQVKWNGRQWKAHRLIYELLVAPIPEGLMPDHLCRNTSCVSPWHIEPVTNRENQLRGGAPPVTHCWRGHPYDEVNTYVGPSGQRLCRACQRISTNRSRRTKLLAR